MQSWNRSGMVLCTYCQHYLVPRISDIPAAAFWMFSVCIGCGWYSWLWYSVQVQVVCRRIDFGSLIFVWIVRNDLNANTQLLCIFIDLKLLRIKSLRFSLHYESKDSCNLHVVVLLIYYNWWLKTTLDTCSLMYVDNQVCTIHVQIFRS